MSLHHYQVSLSILVEVREKDLNQQIHFDLAKLLDNLTDAVITYEQFEKLDYYPALSYLAESKAVSEELFELLNSACRITRLIAANLVQTKLQAAFSQIHITTAKHLAYHIPKVKPHQPDVRAALKYHYRPHLLYIDMDLSQIHKQAVADNYDKFSRHLVYRWLSEYFERIEVLPVK